MNDWWNDPPEESEVLPCSECRDQVEWDPGKGGVVCPKCGYVLRHGSKVEPWPLYDTLEERREAYGEPIAEEEGLER
jgi:transcription initiation factor TFIIIB Brf1 subunit/transcription initiation factor TFIIB